MKHSQAGGQTDAAATRQFDPRMARLMTIWCLAWLLLFFGRYIQLTWRFVSDLQGFPWILVLSPTFWIWLGVFAGSIFVAERLVQMPWHRFERQLSLGKVAGLIFALPLVLWAILVHVLPYLYPVAAGSIRLVPVVGGRGF